LFLYRRIIFGALVKPSLQAIEDLTAREVAILAPLVVITIALGFYPKPVLDVTTPAVAKLIKDNKTTLAMEHEGNQVSIVLQGATQADVKAAMAKLTSSGLIRKAAGQ